MATSPSTLLRRSLLIALVALAGLSALAAPDRSYSTTKVMSLEVRALVQMLEHYHYNKSAVTSADYPEMIEQYMAGLDPQHLFFTAEDRDTFRRLYGPRIETDLSYLGNIDAAFKIFQTYEQRVQSRVNWIFAQLGQEKDFTGEETYSPDRTEAAWPAAGQEADDLWLRRLKYELLQDIVGGKDLADARQTLRKRYERMVKNIADIEDSDIQELYLSSLTKMYDPHSSYFSADTLEDFSIQMKLSLVGIGAVLGLDDNGYCVVREVVPGGPAYLSGQIRVNDKIVAVRQDEGESIEVIGMKLRRIVDMIRGQKDTRVTLSIQPHDAGDASKIREVAIIRDVIKLSSARASATIHEVSAPGGGTVPVGVISLNSFYDGASSSHETEDKPSGNTATQDVAELIGKLKREGIQALVIDLRRNGGGLLSEAIDMTGLFIEQGPVVQVRDSLGRLTIDRDMNRTVAYDGPLAVLTSRYSASASEIFAGALQNYGRAVVIGDSSTHGKGTVQAVLEMKNYLRQFNTDVSRTGAAKLTIQKFYLPNGASTQKKGVIPDITLPSIEEFLPIGESDLPHALMWDEIRPTSFEGRPLDPSFLEPLRQASLDRQQNLEEFAYLRRNIEWFRTQQERNKVVPLNLQARREQKQANDEFRKAQEAERARLALTNYPSREIKLDSVVASPVPESNAPAPEVNLDELEAGPADDATGPKFDIALREALRVVADTLRQPHNPLVWVGGRAPAVAAVDGSDKS
jgi:carboxyl-terminal processing protease